MFILKKHLVLYVERLGYKFAAMFVTFACITYFALQIFNPTKDTFLVSQEKKLTKFVIFLMYECSIFSINIMVHINLVVNSVLF